MRVFGNSPFLGRLAQREVGALGEYFAAGPQVVLNAAILLAAGGGPCRQRSGGDESDLRTAKRRAALAIAMADIAGDVGRQQGDGGTDALCRCLCRRRLALSAAQPSGGVRANVPEVAEDSACGLTVLAMGKYGAFELNYSSDIDLVVFYDAEKFPFAKRGDPRGAAVDIVRGLVKLLSEATATAMSSGWICACAPMRAPRRWRSPPMRRWITMRPWARTGSAPP